MRRVHFRVSTLFVDVSCDFTWMSWGICCTLGEVYLRHESNVPRTYPAVFASWNCARIRCTGNCPWDDEVSTCTVRKKAVSCIDIPQPYVWTGLKSVWFNRVYAYASNLHDLAANYHNTAAHFEIRARWLERKTRLYMLRMY
jgi:hypothetical protein